MFVVLLDACAVKPFHDEDVARAETKFCTRQAPPAHQTPLSLLIAGAAGWWGGGRCRECIDGETAQRWSEAAYLLELLDGTLVNTTALVDQVCCVW